MGLIYGNVRLYTEQMKRYLDRHGIELESVVELEVYGVGVKGDLYKITYYNDDGWLCTIEALVGIKNG